MISNIANVNLLWTTRLIKRGVHFTYVNTYCTNHSPGRNQDTHDDNIVVLFPGQGSQFVGMGAEIADTSIGKNLYHRASQILGYDIGKLSSQGPKTKLDSTVYCQPAVIVASLAAYQIWRQQTPDLVKKCVAAAGFSVGEFAALVIAEAISFEDAIKIIKHRSESMQKASDYRETGMITTLGLDLAQSQQVCDKVVSEILGSNAILQVANVLFNKCCVLAGDIQGLNYIKDNYRQLGFKRAKSLPVSGAFHTPAMSQVQSNLKAILRDVSITMPKYDVYSNVTARPYESVSEIKNLLQEQVTKPVLWEQSINLIYNKFKTHHWYEFGPGTQLTTTIKKILPNVKVYNIKV